MFLFLLSRWFIYYVNNFSFRYFELYSISSFYYFILHFNNLNILSNIKDISATENSFSKNEITQVAAITAQQPSSSLIRNPRLRFPSQNIITLAYQVDKIPSAKN